MGRLANRLCVLAGCAIVFANPCQAFVAAPRLRALPRTLARGVSARQRVEAKAALAEAKDFLGWVLVPPPPPLDSTTVEGAELFRMVGVPPDASYEELTAQVEKLKKKYEGNIKKIKRIEVAKDRIVELRLRQRAQGTIGVNAGAAMRDAEDADESAVSDAVRKTFSRALRRLPDVKVMDESKRQKLMPEEQEAQQKHMGAAKIYFAATTIPGVVFPKLTVNSQLIAFLLTFYHMMCRGRDMKVEVDAPRSSRNVTWRQFKDFLTVFFYLQLAVIAGKLLLTRGPIISGVLALVLTKPVRVMLGHNVGCFLCDYYLQVFDKKKNEQADQDQWAPADDDDDDD